jgi:hypothetical protein
VCFVVRKTISELERVILTTLFLLVQTTLIVGMLGREICIVLFLKTFRWFLHPRSPSLPTLNV